ncbi:MAG: hypothetical protein C4290_14790, partial [Chloroflexota bacterium]
MALAVGTAAGVRVEVAVTDGVMGAAGRSGVTEVVGAATDAVAVGAAVTVTARGKAVAPLPTLIGS